MEAVVTKNEIEELLSKDINGYPFSYYWNIVRQELKAQKEKGVDVFVFESTGEQGDEFFLGLHKI
jgi:hypothetical protein